MGQEENGRCHLRIGQVWEDQGRVKDCRGTVTAPQGCFTGVPGLVLTPVTCPQGEESRLSRGEVYQSKIEMEGDMDVWDEGTDERLKGWLGLSLEDSQ